MKKGRYILALFLCAALFLTVTACGKTEEDGVPLRSGTTFTIAVAVSPDSMNPVVSTGGLAEELFLLCYDPLWRLDENEEPVPCLVDSWSLSSDGLTWTIRLRQDVTFSDGVALTSADVQFTYELMSSYSAMYKDYFDGIASIKCPDDYTVVITTEYIKSDMTYNTTPILPRHLWRDYSRSPSDFENAEMIGTGPFVYDTEASSEDLWVFRARDDYFGQTSQVDEVHFSYYNSVASAAKALSNGEVDACLGLTDVQLTTLENVPGVQLFTVTSPQAECRAIAFNTRSELLSEEWVRQALEYCIDRETFLLLSSGGAGQTGSVFVSPGADEFLTVSDLRGYWPTTALQTFTSRGYWDSDEDGILEYLGTEDELSLVMYSSNLDEWASTAAAIVAGDLAEVGIDVTWKKTTSPITEVCGASDNWDICMYSWKGSMDPVITGQRFMTDIGDLTGWFDLTFDNLLYQMRTSNDEEQMLSLSKQMQQVVYDACPVIVLSYAADIQAIRNDKWTGYEDVVDAAGGLFGIGSIATYMNITPLE